MNGYFNDKDPRELKPRVIFALVFMALGFFVIFVRLWYLQVLESRYYTELAENNRIRIVRSPAPRGLIYDSAGVKLADNRPGFDLYLVPEDVTDWPRTKRMLGELAGLAPEEIDETLRKYSRRPAFQAVKLKEDLTWEETVKIESFKFEVPGTILDVNPKRNYIHGPELAHLIGYLGEINEKEMKALKGYAQGDLVGKSGLEKRYEDALRGTDGVKEIEVDARGRRIKVVDWSPPFPGNDVELTIDYATQKAAWDALDGRAGAVVAIEPETGRVRAMVSSPSYDPNLLASGVTPEQWKAIIEDPMDVLTNRAIQGQYPPASTFKPLHAVAALEEGAVTPATAIFSGPSFWFSGREYRDWKAGGHGTINIHRAIVESSDTFFYQVGLKLGVDTIAAYARRFGLGSRTGIELRNEKPGLVPTSSWKRATYGTRWFEGETISVGVGQGYMLATPVQLAVAYGAIANGGTLYTPRLVEEVRTPQGETVMEFEPVEKGRVNISASTMEHVRDALRGVVHDEDGTASFLRWSRLKIAGKTGTAQVTRLKEKVEDIEEIPYKLRDHAWFVGFAPYDDPKLVVAALVEHGGFGASAAAPVAREVFRAYLEETKDEGSGARIIKVRSDAARAVRAVSGAGPEEAGR